MVQGFGLLLVVGIDVALACALTAGSALDEHENPGEATIQVLRGRVRLTAGQVTWDGRTGDLLVVPDARHALEATEDSAILLTVSKTGQAS